MIAALEPLAASLPAAVSDQYVVAFGKSGGLGCFTVVDDLTLSRGDRVVVRSGRGVELGQVLGPATLRQARLIGALAAGDVLRRATGADEACRQRLTERADELFAACRDKARRLELGLEILDAELFLDGQTALVQFVGANEQEVARLAAALHDLNGLELRFENLAATAVAEEDEPAEGGCGKPDCGRSSGGSCSTCSSGGCSSCGTGPADLRPYFSHLREKMEESQRTPLL